MTDKMAKYCPAAVFYFIATRYWIHGHPAMKNDKCSLSSIHIHDPQEYLECEEIEHFLCECK